MALTISIEGKGVIANADAETDDTGGTGTGDWGFTGSGGVAWGLTTDTYLYGSSSISAAFSGTKAGWLYFDIGAGNELDFDVAGTEEGQHLYLWIHCPTIGLTSNISNPGVAIRIGSSTSDYRTFSIAGADDTNGWNGGWRCIVIDPTKSGSITDGGSFDVGAVRYIGAYMSTTATAKGDNLFISQIAVGAGLRITGTSTTGWDDSVAYCTDYPNRAWGMLQEREGIYYAYGTLYIGDATSQSANVSFTNPSGKVLQFGVSEYYYSTAWVTSADIDYSGIVIEDHTSYTTAFEDGTLVGSDAGRSGSTIIGNTNHNVYLDLHGGNHANSATKLYGTVFKDITGTINLGDDNGHLMYSVVFEGCSQVDPVGAPIIRNCLFINTADADAALLWNESINIQYCKFIANTNGAAVEHPSAAGSPYTHANLTYSGNSYDILNSSGSAIVVTQQGISDPSTYEGSTVSFQSSVTITITVQDINTDPIQNVQTAVYKLSDRSVIMNEDTTALGVAEEAYTGATPVDVEIRCRKASSGTTRYRNFSTLGTISGDFDLLVTLLEDPNNNATS